jgi:cyclophilin family peptidyl-prolyl cis-trans isomerase
MGRTIQVFFNISIGTATGGKIVFELFNDVAPNTVMNFVGLCTGQYGKSKRSGLPLSYKGCHFFKIVPGSIVQSGDFEFNNGEGGESIFGGTFHNESMLRRHCQAGVLSMVSDDKKCVGSQFMITLHRASQYDGKQVVFGQLIEGMDILRAIEKCPITSTHCPKVPIIITDCGIEKKLPGKRRNDPKNQMREAVELLMSTVTCPPNSKSQPLSEAQRGLRKLQQVLENSKKQEESVPLSQDIQIHDSSKESPVISHAPLGPF